MDMAETVESGWRGSVEAWLEAAHDILVESGVDAVRILPLARRLKIARTSFYWHFKDRDALLTALADRWANRTSAGLIAAGNAFAESETEAMLNVVSCFLDEAVFDSRLEFAIRSWAMQDRAIMARLRAEDGARLAALTGLFRRWGHDDTDADTRARTVYLTQIGYISMQQREDLSVRMRRIPAYVQIYTGRAPEPRELARFHARHGYNG